MSRASEREVLRPLLTEEHEAFRRTVRAFVEKEVVPQHAQWESDGQVSRKVWTRAGELGLLCFDVDEAYGGPGVADFRYNMVLAEELTRAGAHGPGFGVHTDIVVPYLTGLGTDEQKQRWLPGCVSGQTITAIAMTEPGAGSDLQGIGTRAVDKGDHYVLSGSKTFISNGAMADLVVVVARTDPSPDRAAGHRGISLLVVERGMAGFERGRNLDKVGMHAQDTSELFFDEVVVPKANLLGEVGSGFVSLMGNLPQERLSIAVAAVASMRSALDLTLAYVTERRAFGQTIGSFQNSRFVLAEIATEVDVAQHFVDDCVRALLARELTAVDAAKAKWWTTELQGRVLDRCLQLHGGYGYMNEYPIARAFADARITRIYGGATEIMKEVIGRDLGL
jgi:alkylation response protein AidB-like acyl-CoA dehydrogenase